MLQKLQRTSLQGQKALDGVGLSSDEVRRVLAEDGLLAALQLLDEKLGSGSEQFNRFFDDVEGRTGAVALLANGGREASEVLDATANSVGTLDEAFARLQETDEFKADQALAQLKATAIDAGSELLPAFAGIADAGASVLEVFGQLPDPVQKVVLTLGLLVGAAGPVISAAGRISLAVDRITRSTEAASAAGSSSAGGAAGLGKLGGGLAAVAAGLTAYAGTLAILDAAGTAGSVQADAEGLGASLLLLGSNGELAGELTDKYGADLEGLGEIIDRVANDSGFTKLQRFLKDQGSLEADQKSIDQLDKALAALVDGGHAEQAQEAFQLINNKLHDQGLTTDDVVGLFDDYGGALDNAEVAGRAEAAAAEDSGQSHQTQAGGIEESTDALEEQYDALLAGVAAQAAAMDASKGVESARADLAEAERAAAGDSDEYRSAQQAIADADQEVIDRRADVVAAREAVAEAERGVIDAEAKVVDAYAEVRKAEEALTEAREDAIRSIRDRRQAAREASLDVSEKELALAQAEQELGRARNTVGLDPLELRGYELAVEKARSALAGSQIDAADAAREAAEAQRLGVEGAPEVVAAHEAVRDAVAGVSEAEQGRVDAEGKVRDAVDGVSDANRAARKAERDRAAAGRAAAKVLSDAKARVVEATETLRDAQLDEARAWADLARQEDGATAGMQVYRDMLARLRDDLDPGSPLRANLNGLIADLDYLIDQGRESERLFNYVEGGPADTRAAEAQRAEDSSRPGYGPGNRLPGPPAPRSGANDAPPPAPRSAGNDAGAAAPRSAVAAPRSAVAAPRSFEVAPAPEVPVPAKRAAPAALVPDLRPSAGTAVVPDLSVAARAVPASVPAFTVPDVSAAPRASMGASVTIAEGAVVVHAPVAGQPDDITLAKFKRLATQAGDEALDRLHQDLRRVL